jgi:molybdate transport system ATP-binding protein
MTLAVNIQKKLDAFLLRMEFQAEDEMLALLGASGCGKSMTLKCIAGVETPDEGRIVLNGRVLFDSARHINLSPQQRHVGYLFQNYALFPHMTVAENIAVGMRRPKAERGALVREKIQTFYLEGLEKKYPHQLSGGQQQRVALARILASEPEIMMLDEPFAALDSYLKWQMEKELMSVVAAFHGTTLFVSHDRDEAYRLCPRIAVLSEGSIDVLREREALMQNPETLAAARITGCKNFSRARRLSSQKLYAVDWDTELTTKGELPTALSYIGYRAHFIELAHAGAASEPNVFPCRLQQVLEDTFTYIIMLTACTDRVGESEFTALRVELPKKEWLESDAAAAPLAAGSLMYIRLRPDKILALV